MCSNFWMAVCAGLVLCIGLPPRAAAQAASLPDARAADVPEKRVTLDLENADIRYALKLLFSAAGVDYVVDQGVQGLVTVSINDKPFGVALQSVLRGTASTLPLTYRIENGVYNVLPRGEPELLPARTPETPETETPSRRFRKLDVLRHVDASTMASLLSQAGVRAGMISASRWGAGGQGGGYGTGGYGGGLGGYGQSGYGGGGFGVGYGSGMGGGGAYARPGFGGGYQATGAPGGAGIRGATGQGGGGGAFPNIDVFTFDGDNSVIVRGW